ncbi:MAG: mycothiol synthase [Beutenbergiaceae bacterium]
MTVSINRDPAADQVQALAAQVAQHDGVEAFSEQTLLNLSADRPIYQFGLDLDGALVGYAQVDADSAELAVHPQYRRRGWGTRLLDAVLAHPVNIWAHGPTPGAAPLAARRELIVTRQLWLMTAPPPPPIPPPVVPDDLILTTFTRADIADWVAVNARAFAAHPEQGRMTAADLSARMAEPWFDPQVFWLVRDALGQLLGSMWLKIADGLGEIYVLGIDPRAQGRRIGSLLTAVAMHAFAQRDLRGLELYVEGDNDAAIRTYLRAGFTRARADLQYAAQG